MPPLKDIEALVGGAVIDNHQVIALLVELPLEEILHVSERNSPVSEVPKTFVVEMELVVARQRGVKRRLLREAGVGKRVRLSPEVLSERHVTRMGDELRNLRRLVGHVHARRQSIVRGRGATVRGRGATWHQSIVHRTPPRGMRGGLVARSLPRTVGLVGPRRGIWSRASGVAETLLKDNNPISTYRLIGRTLLDKCKDDCILTEPEEENAKIECIVTLG